MDILLDIEGDVAQTERETKFDYSDRYTMLPNLRDIRRSKGIGIKRLAELCHTRKQTLMGWELLRNGARRSNVEMLCKKLGVYQWELEGRLGSEPTWTWTDEQRARLDKLLREVDASKEN